MKGAVDRLVMSPIVERALTRHRGASSCLTVKVRIVIQSVFLTGCLLAVAAQAETTAKTAHARESLNALEYESAIEQAHEVIARYDSPHERYSAALIDPLLVVGEALMALERPADAFLAFERAQSISRVNHGLHSVEQIPSLRWQAKALVALDDYRSATDRLETGYLISLDQYPENSPEALAAALELADWYAAHFHVFFARALYDRAFRIATVLDADVEQRVGILRQIAWTYRMEFYPTRFPGKFRPSTACCGGHSTSIRFGRLSSANRRSADRALIAAANLLGESQSANRELLADVLLELGDWYMLRDRKERARETYVGVWDLIDEARRAEVFGQPAVLYRPHPGNPQRPPEPYDPTPHVGFIQIAVRVNDNGHVRAGPKVERSIPENLLAIKYLRQARYARFRPAFDDGELSNSGEAKVLYAFRYHPRQ